MCPIAPEDIVAVARARDRLIACTHSVPLRLLQPGRM
jgi:hypothetical protein